MGATYLLGRDKIHFLLDGIAALENLVVANQNRATRLVAPSHASHDPITSKKRNLLLTGLFGGLFGSIDHVWASDYSEPQSTAREQYAFQVVRIKQGM